MENCYRKHDLGHQKLHIVNSILIQQFQPLAGHAQKDHHQYGQNNFQYFHFMHAFYVFLNIVFWYFLIQTLPDFLPYRIFRMANSSARACLNSSFIHQNRSQILPQAYAW